MEESHRGQGDWHDRYAPTVVMTDDIVHNSFQELYEDFVNEDISAKDAIWFLEILEAYNLQTLNQYEREALRASKLRSKNKHQACILFHDDVHFVLESTERLELDMNNTKCQKSPGKWMIHQSCKFLAREYRESIMVKEDRSFIWSALMDRAAFFLRRSGFGNVFVDQSRRKEASLILDHYKISRSNFTKIFKRYCYKEGTLKSEDGHIATKQAHSVR